MAEAGILVNVRLIKVNQLVPVTPGAVQQGVKLFDVRRTSRFDEGCPPSDMEAVEQLTRSRLMATIPGSRRSASAIWSRRRGDRPNGFQGDAILPPELPNEIGTTRDEADPHLRSEWHIRPACLDYTAFADNHAKLLRIDHSERRPCRDWSVFLGTGSQEALQSRRIFYDQMRFRAPVGWSTARTVVPLYSRVGHINRRLVIDTSAWPEVYRRALKTEINDATYQGAEA